MAYEAPDVVSAIGAGEVSQQQARFRVGWLGGGVGKWLVVRTSESQPDAGFVIIGRSRWFTLYRTADHRLLRPQTAHDVLMESGTLSSLQRSVGSVRVGSCLIFWCILSMALSRDS